MPQYTPPLRDMQFVLHELLDAVTELKRCRATPRSTPTRSTRCSKKAASSRRGDVSAQPVRRPRGLHAGQGNHEVRTPKGFKEAYAQYVEGGWPSLSCDPEYGGQGLPVVLNQCFYEMLNSANQAWTMYPGLSHGAYEACTRTARPSRRRCTCPSWSAASGPARCA
jgi:hypothetical protein